LLQKFLRRVVSFDAGLLEDVIEVAGGGFKVKFTEV
jgi:hypothetical protein